MPVLAVRTFRRLLVASALALLPGACSGQADVWGSQPDDSLRLAGAVQPGASGLGAYLAALHAHAHHRSAAAADFYDAALGKDPENVELLQRAFMLTLTEGRTQRATELAKQLTVYDPGASLAVMFLAMQDAKAGAFAAAEARLAALPKRGINAFVSPLLIAWTRVGQGRTDQALQVLSPLANNSHLAILHDFHAGLITDLADRRIIAEEYYRNTVSTPGGITVRAVQAVGSFYLRQGNAGKADEVYGAYFKQHPDSRLFDAEGLLALGKDAPRIVGSAQDGLAEALFGAASTLRQSNANDAAMLFIRMALDLRPDLALAQMLLADILQGQGRLRDANAVYAEIAPTAPVWWSAQLRLAANLDELGDVDAAATLLRKLAEVQADRPDALVTLGEVLRRHERFADAARAYELALHRIGETDQRHWTLFYSRGISYERSGQWQQAESDFLKALELEPEQPHVLNYLGYSWVEKGINLPQARRMIEKAVELRPNDGYIVDSLGWVLYRLGDYDQAVVHLERAVELRPDDATINDHLGDALWKVGRIEEARFQWRRTLGLAKEQPMIDAVKAKLASGLGETAAVEARN